MEKKGFQVKEAKSVAEGLNIVRQPLQVLLVIDLRLEDGNGLDVVKELSKNKKDSRIVMLTGYGNLPTARLKMHRRTLQRILSKRSPR